jgi:isopentenyl diphosphate isomerase/L-lactate dehydrogenase-like FMN-dependent dehydrogenase
VDRVLNILTTQFRSTLALLGVSSIAELRRRGPELLTEIGTV